MSLGRIAWIASMVALTLSCGAGETEPPAPPPEPEAVVSSPEASEVPDPVEAPPNALRNLYWGDTHLHTSYSPDAYLMRNRSADPDTAYRFAKGLPVEHPFHKARVQIGTPLDFLVVSDHAEFMGVVPRIVRGDPLVVGTATGKRYKELADAGKEIEVFSDLIAQVNGVIPPHEDLNSPEINRSVWAEIIDAAERHNDPGTFTAFLGWEWSSTPGGANLHRVIVLREGRETGEKMIPFSSLSSAKPEDLWAWLDSTSEATGAHFLAIPHNSNISQGLMFPLEDSSGNVLSPEYAQQRMRWEKIVEVTQIKGDSETHPRLSPTDEFADYETYDHLIAAEGAESEFAFGDAFLGVLSPEQRTFLESDVERAAKVGDYARAALIRGMAVEQQIGENPYKFGMIGSTDAHTGIASAEEDNFHGKMALDSTPATKSEDILPGTPGWDMGAAGLVAVWAEENTRASLFDAMQRREAYATTGPRIQLRFFGGYGFAPGDEEAQRLAETGYAKGVPMGGDLPAAPADGAPSFLIASLKDPVGANLDRIQVVKGWVDADGVPHEKIFDVAASDGRRPGVDGRLPPVGSTVDLANATYTNTIGAAELRVVWTDPEFDPSLRALYYTRVLEIPTPRHTLFDAIALGIDPSETGNPPTIQERAYSSPIWYTP